MSVNGSKIIGPITNNTEVFLVGRSGNNYFTYTDRGFISYASSYRGNYYLFKTNFDSGVLSMRARQAYKLFPKHKNANQKYYCNNHPYEDCSCCEDAFAEEKKCYNVFRTGCELECDERNCDEECGNECVKPVTYNKFKLIQCETKVPGDKLYAGIWYNFTIGDLEDVLFKVCEPKNSAKGFAKSIGKSAYARIDVTFIPFSDSMSFFHEGECLMKYRQTPFKFFEWWTKGQNLSESCERDLNSGSRFCVFTGSSCLDRQSYRYCCKNETCGNCLGACEVGGQCLSKGSGKFYCFTGNQEAKETAKSHKWVIIVTLIIFFSIVIFLLMIYGVRKWRGGN